MSSKRELFLELAKPNNEGISDWVYTEVLKEKGLGFGNGGDFIRRGSKLDKDYVIEKKYNGNKIEAIRLNGFKESKEQFSQYIPKDISEKIKKMKCPILGTSNPEVDHKDGRKTKTCYNLEDYQPLSKAANDAKRQFCKECKNTNKRFDAKTLGYKISFTEGNEEYKGSCKGCFWYDVLDFRSKLN